ncbi:MAG: DUF4142 domain-containing protein [Bacteroidota bacterium]|nr:DUF4142 domain-containing protein [Bacteroidota bacterium]MDP4252302.1 DUF4142 domain-containing protein [Bacteroidota bacterium]
MKQYFESVTGVSIVLCSVAFLAFSIVDDPSFLSRASQANLAEIEAGKLAAYKGTSAVVKKYGQKMVADHTTAQAELVALAKKENTTIPKEPDPEHQALKEQLASLSGNAFDSAYIKSQLTDHQAAVSLFTEELTTGTDPDAIAYAKKYLPRLKMHLNMIQKADSATAQPAR